MILKTSQVGCKNHKQKFNPTHEVADGPELNTQIHTALTRPGSKVFRRPYFVEQRLFWQVMACDKPKGMLPAQLGSCSQCCPLQQCSLPATSNCKLCFVQSRCVHFTSDFNFCSSLRNTSSFISCLRSDLILPLFLLYCSFSILRVLGYEISSSS